MPFPNYIFADTADDKLDESRLHREIFEEGPFSATFQGVSADRNAKTFIIAFAGPLGPAEKATVDGVVAAHIGAPLFECLRKINRSSRVHQGTRTIIVTDLAAALSVFLPPAVDFGRDEFLTVKDGSGLLNGVTLLIDIVANGSELIDGASSKTIANAFGALTIVSDGVASWYVV